MLIDSHCHLDLIDLKSFDNQFDQLIQYATKNDVSQFLCVCIDLEHFQDVLDIAEKYPQIFCSVGVHPTNLDSQAPSVDKIVTLAQNKCVIAIGETGLDYFRTKNETIKTEQHRRLRIHIQAAKEVHKPLIIHTRAAKKDTIKILTEEKAHEVGGVMHCFAEDWHTAKQALDLGFYISFSGIVTFHNAENLREVAKKVPVDRILIETDSPWLAPVPKRGKLNQPAYVKYVAEKMAELRKISYEEIAHITTNNFNRLFLGKS